MTMAVMQIAGWLTTSLLGGLVGWLGNMIRRDRGRDHALDEGMRVLLRAHLIDLHERYVERGEPCPVDVKTEADETYEAYHAIGGNGTGTHLHKEIMDAHIKNAVNQ